MAITYDMVVHASMDELFDRIIDLAPLIHGNPFDHNAPLDFIRQVAHMRPLDCYFSLLPTDVLTQVHLLISLDHNTDCR